MKLVFIGSSITDGTFSLMMNGREIVSFNKFVLHSLDQMPTNETFESQLRFEIEKEKNPAPPLDKEDTKFAVEFGRQLREILKIYEESKQDEPRED